MSGSTNLPAAFAGDEAPNIFAAVKVADMCLQAGASAVDKFGIRSVGKQLGSECSTNLIYLDLSLLVRSRGLPTFSATARV